MNMAMIKVGMVALALTALVAGVESVGSKAATTANERITNSFTNFVDVPITGENYVAFLEHVKVLPDVITVLAKSGKLCEARGHAWRELPNTFPMGGGFYEVAPGDIQARECQVCGKVQCRKVGVWQ